MNNNALNLPNFAWYELADDNHTYIDLSNGEIDLFEPFEDWYGKKFRNLIEYEKYLEEYFENEDKYNYSDNEIEFINLLKDANKNIKKAKTLLNKMKKEINIRAK